MAEENEHIDYELITKVLAGEASLDEVETVRHWREASKHNALAFSEMETLWNKAGKVMPHQKAQVDVDKGWQKLNARIDEIENSKVQQHSQGEVKNLYYRSEEHTSELQSRENLVCRLLLEKKKE